MSFSEQKRTPRLRAKAITAETKQLMKSVRKLTIAKRVTRAAYDDNCRSSGVTSDQYMSAGLDGMLWRYGRMLGMVIG